MRIALKELLRQPGRFASVGGALTLLVVLLIVLGGFLDGLELSQTGPYRAHDDKVLVFTEESELLIQRSRLDPGAATVVREADGVAEVGTLNLVASTASARGDDAIADIVLFGYDSGTSVLPAPPGGDAIVDQALADRIDIAVGDTLLLGATAEPVIVDAIIDDLSQGAPTVWVSSAQWRAIVGAGNPASLPPDGVSQALVVTPAGDVSSLATSLSGIDGISAVTATQAIDALPVVQQQSSTFEGIIGVTFIVTLMVVALFFALITLERVGLYAVLKALGARTSDLIAGISAQAVVVSIVALILGTILAVIFTQLIPAELPVRLVPSRLVQVAVGVLLTSLVGSLFTLRRVLRIDPAEAIG